MNYVLAFALPLSIAWSLLNYLGIEIVTSPALNKFLDEVVSWTIPSLGWLMFIIGLIAMLGFNYAVEKGVSDDLIKNDNLLRKTLRAITPFEFIGLLILGHYWVAASLAYSTLIGLLLRGAMKEKLGYC